MQMSVYTWGANSHGQLGLGFESELCMAPQRLSSTSFNVAGVRSICGGGGHVLVLDNCGRLHSCGWNNRGQLGLNSEANHHNVFQSVPSEFFEDVPIESIACGWDISGCITVNKKLYVWGSNSFQQLGICQRGFTAVRRPLPVTLPRGDIAQRISFGLRHCAILTEDNKIYVFGRLRVNDPAPTELQITATTLNRAPVLKILPQLGSNLRFFSLASGQHHLLIKVASNALEDVALSTARRVLALGDNKYGQSNAFQFEADIKQVVCGWTHNAVLLRDGRIFVWGRNAYGQLGTGTATDCQPLPVQLPLPEQLQPARLHLGSEHGMLRSSDGLVYSWGWNEHGNCGNNTTENIYSPTLITLPNACRIAGAGAGFCYALCDA